MKTLKIIGLLIIGLGVGAGDLIYFDQKAEAKPGIKPSPSGTVHKPGPQIHNPPAPKKRIVPKQPGPHIFRQQNQPARPISPGIIPKPGPHTSAPRVGGDRSRPGNHRRPQLGNIQSGKKGPSPGTRPRNNVHKPGPGQHGPGTGPALGAVPPSGLSSVSGGMSGAVNHQPSGQRENSGSAAPSHRPNSHSPGSPTPSQYGIGKILASFDLIFWLTLTKNDSFLLIAKYLLICCGGVGG